MKVLVIPEDIRNDGYLLTPIINRMFRAIGFPRAKVVECRDPVLGGVEEALKWELIEEIIDEYHYLVDVFVLVVDRDCDQDRQARLDRLESLAAAKLGESKLFLAQLAWQELEVWTLAGLDERPKEWKWRDIRKECHPKEKYFEKLARDLKLDDSPGQGRSILGERAAARYPAIKTLCPEDFGSLEKRLKAQLK